MHPSPGAERNSLLSSRNAFRDIFSALAFFGAGGAGADQQHPWHSEKQHARILGREGRGEHGRCVCCGAWQRGEGRTKYLRVLIDAPMASRSHAAPQSRDPPALPLSRGCSSSFASLSPSSSSPLPSSTCHDPARGACLSGVDFTVSLLTGRTAAPQLHHPDDPRRESTQVCPFSPTLPPIAHPYLLPAGHRR